MLGVDSQDETNSDKVSREPDTIAEGNRAHEFAVKIVRSPLFGAGDIEHLFHQIVVVQTRDLGHLAQALGAQAHHPGVRL